MCVIRSNAPLLSITERGSRKTFIHSLCYTPQVEKNINNMTVKMPHQLFINGEFVDAEGGKTYKTINPCDGMVRKSGDEDSMCQRQNVSLSWEKNIVTAVQAPQISFLCVSSKIIH